jgi:site-specific recombinase
MYLEIFSHYQLKQAVSQADTTALLTALIAEIRPADASRHEEAAHAIQALCFTLNQHADFAALLRDAILQTIQEKKSVSLFADSGIQTNHGFFAELFRRISHRILPDAIDAHYLKDVFGLIFHAPSDAEWVCNVDDDIWKDLFVTLQFQHADAALKSKANKQLVDAIQVLSYRLSASGLESDLIKNHSATTSALNNGTTVLATSWLLRLYSADWELLMPLKILNNCRKRAICCCIRCSSAVS